MPITTANPITRDGKTYDKLAVSLAVSPGMTGNAMQARVVLSLQPYHEAEDGAMSVPMTDGAPDRSVIRNVIFGDAYAAAASDPDLAQALNTILTAIGGYVAAKGY